MEPRPAEPGDVRRNGGATELARKVLDWAPEIGLEEGIRSEVEWMRQAIGDPTSAIDGGG